MEFIVSIQGRSSDLTHEMALECISGGATMIRTDKPIHCRVPLIGLWKIKVKSRSKEPYITPSLDYVKKVSKWARFVAVDCRVENVNNLKDIFSYAEHNGIKIVADIQKKADYENLISCGYNPAYITTALGVFGIKIPPYDLIDFLLENGECRRLIAEGNIGSTYHVRNIANKGVDKICIGNAISNTFKLTKKYFHAMMSKE